MSKLKNFCFCRFFPFKNSGEISRLKESNIRRAKNSKFILHAFFTILIVPFSKFSIIDNKSFVKNHTVIPK